MKTALKLSRKFFSGYFSSFASLASIIGLVLVFICDKNKAIIALVCFILFLLLILYRLFHITNLFILQKTGNGEHKFATYINWTDVDEHHIVYEIQKFVQCKTLIITEHTHNFHWTGTNPPVVSSNQQDFLRVEKSANGEDYDKAIFRFKKPLTYNDFTIIQFKMDIDNSDNKGKKYVAHKVEENIQLINFRVELMYLVNGKDAKILRKKLNTSLEMSFENIGFVKFEEKTKSYSHSIYNPEVGYTYRLDWS